MELNDQFHVMWEYYDHEEVLYIRRQILIEYVHESVQTYSYNILSCFVYLTAGKGDLMMMMSTDPVSYGSSIFPRGLWVMSM